MKNKQFVYACALMSTLMPARKDASWTQGKDIQRDAFTCPSFNPNIYL